ncbi:unnamed protein product [Echinostoma caproni]|uniref:UBA domain-containing protein n=1 Tax=Echinostoma caproni TaxID=27848 RepID=A0A3P8H2H4_9TREM|nr:unnamed protein product [Echinostoma caproni]
MRPVRGIITRNLGQSMVEITDLTDASVHRRHIDQIHFRNERTVSASEPHDKKDNPNNSELPESDTTVPQCHSVEHEVAVEPAESEASTNATLRRSQQKASQIDEALLREESCGDRVTSTHAPPYSFQRVVAIMAQSEDSLWTSNFGLWNNPSSDTNVGDIWNGGVPLATGNTINSFQKMNGLTPFIGKDVDKPTDGIKLPDAVDIPPVAVAPVDCGPSVTARSDSTSDNNSVKNNGSSEDSVKTSAFSTEQLCDHLINSNEGWGKRPVDQSTPWDASDVARPGADQLGRSGITTPTPGSCSTSTLVGNFRVAPQVQRHESNVWTSEPPTGTGIWEMHYENNGARSTLWPASTSASSVPATPSTQPNPLILMNNMRTVPQNGTLFPRSGTYRNWDASEKVWNNGGTTPASVPGRPVLGGTRNTTIATHNTIDEGNWNSESNFCMFSNSSNFEASGNCNSWDPVPGNNTGVQWSTAISTGSSNFSVPPFGPPNSDDLRRQLPISTCNPSNNDRMLIHPFSNTYRADLVKYLMSQGFKKEDVQAALIDSNMEPERALHELRERYNPSRSFGVMNQPLKSNFHGAAGNLSQFSGNSTFPGSAGSLVGGGVQIPNSNNFNRNKLIGPSVTSASTQLMSLSPHPNPQLIRQQLTQQVRSALNLSVPTPLAGPLGNATSAGVSAGNSLLGQPPPPLLNASNLLSAHAPGMNQPIAANPTNSFAPSQNRTGSNHATFPNNTPPNLHNGGGPATQSKRHARQAAIFSAIQELQKKRRTIELQVCMYKNNPTMSSQPQCAEMVAELQSQLQQIDAQLRAKMAQLNLASAQDSSVSAIRGQSANNPVEGVSIANQTRVPQDQLVQQLMEMQLKPGRLGSPETADSDFPTIGTWTPHTKANTEHQDKVMFQDSVGPKPITGTRNAAGTSESPNNNTNQNWTGGWSSNGNALNTNVNNVRSGLGNLSNWQLGPRAFSSNLDGSVTGNKTEPQQQPQPPSQNQQPGSQNSGQWLLIHSAPGHHQGNMDLNQLHMLLSQFGLTNFHLLNSFTGLVLVRIQSTELSLRLMYNLADRFTVEAISEPEALTHLQQLNVRLRPENRTSGQFSPLGEMGSLPTGTAPSGSKWVPSDPPSASGFNTVPINSRKPSTHNTRLGVMVSGIH